MWKRVLRDRYLQAFVVLGIAASAAWAFRRFGMPRPLGSAVPSPSLPAVSMPTPTAQPAILPMATPAQPSCQDVTTTVESQQKKTLRIKLRTDGPAKDELMERQLFGGRLSRGPDFKACRAAEIRFYRDKLQETCDFEDYKGSGTIANMRCNRIFQDKLADGSFECLIDECDAECKFRTANVSTQTACK